MKCRNRSTGGKCVSEWPAPNRALSYPEKLGITLSEYIQSDKGRNSSPVYY